MPLAKNISPHKGVPCLKQFNQEEFIKTTEHYGPQLTSGLKGDWIGLYRLDQLLSTFQIVINQILSSLLILRVLFHV